MGASEKRFDVIVFGATGFTGVRVVRYLAGRATPDTRVAVAGRDKHRLEQVVLALDRHPSWAVIRATYDDPASIAEMASAGRVIINCVGPYRHFGLALPEACIRARTDYLDVCGEPEFLERTQLELHDRAVAAGALLIGACGFDSVPSDLGASYLYDALLQKDARPVVNSIECFVSFRYGPDGASVHYPTYESAIYGMANVSNLKQIRRQLYGGGRQSASAQQVPKTTKRATLSAKKPFFYDSRVRKWVVPFPAADASVIRRSFQVLAEDAGRRRPNISVFLTVSSLVWAVVISFWGALLMILSRFSPTRSLLLQYPSLFSFGSVTRSGPSEKQMSETSFQVDIFGEGTVVDGDNSGQYVQSAVRVSGPEPGYAATPIIVVEAALVVLAERDGLRAQGGVLTPAVAFRGSSLIDKLHQAGVRFDMSDGQ